MWRYTCANWRQGGTVHRDWMGVGMGQEALGDPGQDDLARNLRLACSYYPSIAEVCRKLALNRPQFNKYLSGVSRPSAHTLRRLCDFFGVDVHEILLPHRRFAQVLSVRPAAGRREPERGYVPHIDRLQRQSRAGLDKYLGYYFEYYYSMAFPGKVLRSLVCLHSGGDGICYRRMERLSPVGRPASGFRCRYRGMAFLLNERIFLLDYEALTGNELTETILFPTYKSRVNHLAGLKIGVSAADRREPACARVVLESLGQRIDLKSALRQCGLMLPHDASLNPDVVRRIDNRLPGGEHHFLGHPF